MHLDHYVRLSQQAHETLAAAWRALADGHPDEHDVALIARRFATIADDQCQQLTTFVGRHNATSAEPDNFAPAAFQGPRRGGLGLLRDLHDIALLATECDLSSTLLTVGAQGARDTELLDVANAGLAHTKQQLSWLTSRIKQAAPQALVVAE